MLVSLTTCIAVATAMTKTLPALPQVLSCQFLAEAFTHLIRQARVFAKK